MFLTLEPYVTYFLSKKTQKGHYISKKIYQVQGILIGVVAAFVVFITIIGPEHHASHFEKSKTAFEEGGGEIDPETLVEDENDKPQRIESPGVDEKEEKEQL